MEKETSSQKMNTVSESINKAVKSGYRKDFLVENDALTYEGAKKSYRPEEVRIRNFYRFEGESDPADSSILYLLKTSDGTMGTLLDAYGMYADPSIALFVKKVQEIHKKLPGEKTGIKKDMLIIAAVLGGAFLALQLLCREKD